MTFDLGWGNSVCVRKAFLETYDGEMIVFSHDKLAKFDYPKHEGDPELVDLTRNVIERQTGHRYKHILITNGATGGVVIALRMYQQRGYENCHTRNAPYYVRYPRMIRASGLHHCDETYHIWRRESMILLDIPSNPLGLTGPIDTGYEVPVVLDGVYFNKVYMNWVIPTPRHNIMVGSYSKLLGLNGLRTGWIATDSDELYRSLADLVASEYCGLSTASTEIIKTTLFDFNWAQFEQLGRNRLDYNREQYSKLEKFFGDVAVPSNGMFYYAPIDAACRELLEKSGITWTKGSDLGTDDSFGRFNVGQDCALVEQAVKTVLRNDQST